MAQRRFNVARTGEGEMQRAGTESPAICQDDVPEESRSTPPGTQLPSFGYLSLNNFSTSEYHYRYLLRKYLSFVLYFLVYLLSSLTACLHSCLIRNSVPAGGIKKIQKCLNK